MSISINARIEELEEELRVERAIRAKSDKQRSDLQRELEELGERLEEANYATQIQVDLNRKKDAEVQKLQRDLDEVQAYNESQLIACRKKYQDAQGDLCEQIDQLHKGKQKMEKEKHNLKLEVEDLQLQLENNIKGKVAIDKATKQLEGFLLEANTRLSEGQKNLTDMTAQKNRAIADNTEMNRKFQDYDGQLSQLSRVRQILVKQLEEMKAAMEDDSKIYSRIAGENKSLQVVIEKLEEQMDEEQELKTELQKQLTKSVNESGLLRQKLEALEATVKPDEMDELKRRMVARVQEMESQLEATVSKAMAMEKARNKLQAEVEALTLELDKSRTIITQLEKRQRLMEKAMEDWKKRITETEVELENVQKECRIQATEAYRLKGLHDEGLEAIEGLKKENKNLLDEIQDLIDQVGEGNRKIMDMEKALKRMEMEKDEMQGTLEEAEAALAQEAAKVQRSQAEVGNSRADAERRLTEKDDEIEAIRKNHQRAIDSVQMSVEAETRSKMEAVRNRKKLEQDVMELEAALEMVSRARTEAEKGYKKFQVQINDLEMVVDDERQSTQDAQDERAVADKKAADLAAELHETKIRLEGSERMCRSLEGDLQEATERIAELKETNAELSADKRKVESDANCNQAELEDQLNELKTAEDHARKAMEDASRLAEELRQEQDHAGQIERARRSLEATVKDLQVRLDEAEAAAMQGGKKVIQKMEQRIHELEMELENEQHRHNETTKSIRKQERRLKELVVQIDDDRTTHEKMQQIIEKLHQKLKGYKRQVDETEEAANINLGKFRKIQQELEEAVERADMAENTLGHMRAKTRASSVAPSLDSFSSPVDRLAIKNRMSRASSVDVKMTSDLGQRAPSADVKTMMMMSDLGQRASSVDVKMTSDVGQRASSIDLKMTSDGVQNDNNRSQR